MTRAPPIDGSSISDEAFRETKHTRASNSLDVIGCKVVLSRCTRSTLPPLSNSAEAMGSWILDRHHTPPNDLPPIISMSHLHPETSLLTPRDPSTDSDSDAWPEFSLSNAHVHLPDSPVSAYNLLLASEHNPVTVTGQLKPVPQALSQLYKGSSTTRLDAIEIRDVKSFAYGQYSDGAFAIWAAGKAGWYTLKPSRAYRQMYTEMVEAVKMLYFIADAYQVPCRAGKGKKERTMPEYTPQELFGDYAQVVMGLDKASAAVAAEKVYQHREFLLGSMIEGKEGLDWRKNPLFLLLKEKFSHEYAVVQQRVSGPAESTTTWVQEGRQRSVESISTTSILKRKRGRSQKNRDVEVMSLASSSNDTAAQAVKPRKINTCLAKPDHMRTTRRSLAAPTPESVVEESSLPPSATPVLEVSESDSELVPRAHKRKSALRPRSSKRAAGKAPPAQDVEEDELALSPTDANSRQRKCSNSQEIALNDDEGIDVPSSPSAASPSDDDAVAGASPTSLNHRPDPLQEDSWLCALSSCTHKVYLASHPESQRLIRDHYALHAYDDDERVRMVQQLQAPELPAGRLMEKVKLAARWEGFPGSKVPGTGLGHAVGGGVLLRY